MWNVFREGIFQILLWIQSYVGDWGLAIIVLTVLIRMLLWPLTAKQVKGTYELQKVTPEIKKIQEKYADDKEKQQEQIEKTLANLQASLVTSENWHKIKNNIIIALVVTCVVEGIIIAVK